MFYSNYLLLLAINYLLLLAEKMSEGGGLAVKVYLEWEGRREEARRCYISSSGSILQVSWRGKEGREEEEIGGDKMGGEGRQSSPG